ncbi:MAG: hypothetical protein JSU81_10295 [Candidatus Coatesbacteria bacterium]|nr:MAG: hypothetical protein JSU81_10295 [Candidatus Coatesbacteria bacterium]
MANTWFGFTFDKPFYYDGKNNLIMEVDWSTDSGGYAYCRASTATGRFVYRYNSSGPYLQNLLHFQRITITPGGMAVSPTSLGRVKVLFE